MTKDELREETVISDFEAELDSVVCDIIFESRYCNFTSQEGVKMITDLLEDKGWKSPEEIAESFGKYCYKHLRPYPMSTRYEGTKLIWYCRGCERVAGQP